MTQKVNIDFTIYSPRFQEWTGAGWILKKLKDKIHKTDEYNNELSIKDFDNELISLIVEDYVNALNESDNENIRTSFDAGFQLITENIRIGYKCCGEFCNYKNWEKILIEKNSTWTEIWIGHPWIYYRFEKGVIVFSDYTEDPKTIKELVRFDFKEFEISLQDWLKEINRFKRSIRAYFDSRYSDKADYYYNKMIEGK